MVTPRCSRAHSITVTPTGRRVTVRSGDTVIADTTGALTLQDGAGQLESGATELDDGLAQLQDGAGELHTGLGTLDDGAHELASGLSDGVDRVPALTEDERDEAALVMARARALGAEV